ncbi:undecaprenyldiphospho-muramoylpentapeptide beta-N-acetylglucosaminyltransferase [Entomobacter blattae]|uniref:UDP-N-acetylglucosamine--N-acetylmuramyl-(pentapeptide) pyrophosphoryl-undecaprenol N-acetylglucosamine transferase n=1 Tax=Entomobacter blattae TaxID=2762277 RepID=A0A7H1NNS0_9PROT|nr:undecaprenyldiphospho-muramoylpentapeptide beta-N-acetylglucosaminyltransferase [Entomobacter blattae]QNT77430.1 UDP-N-acetylglucosamine transferase [Entomobacter blattae]
MSERKAVIAAGGTGGHFFPAEALANALHQRGYELILMTDSRAGLRKDGIFSSSQQFTLPGAGIAGHSLKRKISSGLALLVGAAQARNILKATHPQVVIGFGGYPSIPPLLGAYLLRKNIRIILHEGNAVLGHANRFLARFADAIGTSFPEVNNIPARCFTALTGMPVREDIAQLYHTPYTPPAEDGPIQLLIWGGSLGARIFGQVVPQTLCQLPDHLRKRLMVTQQVRQEDIQEVNSIYAAAGIHATTAPFFTNIAELLSKAHLVIGRAGGSSVAELTLAGKPAIFVPLPIAANDEQTANARILEKDGAGWVLPQTEFRYETLYPLLVRLLSNTHDLAASAHAVRQHAHPYAAEQLANLVDSTTAHSSRSS